MTIIILIRGFDTRKYQAPESAAVPNFDEEKCLERIITLRVAVKSGH